MSSRQTNDWVATSLKGVAGFFDVSPRTVADWKSRGMPGQNRHYPINEIVQWRQEYTQRRRQEIAARRGVCSQCGQPLSRGRVD